MMRCDATHLDGDHPGDGVLARAQLQDALLGLVDQQLHAAHHVACVTGVVLQLHPPPDCFQKTSGLESG